MELKDIISITYELMRTKEDRLMMRYEDDLSACHRINDNLLKKYKRSTSLLMSLQRDYDLLKRKVLVKKRSIDQSINTDHSTAKRFDCNDNIQKTIEKQNKDINNMTNISGRNFIEKSKTMDTVAPVGSISFSKPNLNDKSVSTLQQTSINACPMIVWVDSQSSISSYEENNHNKEHHHLIVKLLEKDNDQNHFKASLSMSMSAHDNHSEGIAAKRVDDEIAKDNIAPRKPSTTNIHQRSVSVSSSIHLDVGRYGGNRLNDLIGPQGGRNHRHATSSAPDADVMNNIDRHQRQEEKDEQVVVDVDDGGNDRGVDRRNDGVTGRWNNKDDAFDCDEVKVSSNNEPVRKFHRKGEKRRKVVDGKEDDEGREKDQFQQLLDLRTMRTMRGSIGGTSSSNHTNKLNKEALAPSMDLKAVTMKCLETVRGKENRAALPGHTCMECLKFYETMGQQGVYSNFSDSQVRRKVLQSCSRHKAKWSQPSTPEGFWDLSLGTPEDWK